jgi:glycosyltransferase involved in cell wall biosynthesis
LLERGKGEVGERKLRILHFIYDDIKNPWYGGGASLRTHEIYKRMTKNHDITVVTGNYPGAAKKETVDGIRYIRMGLDRSPYLSMLAFSSMVFFAKGIGKYEIVVKDLIPFAPTFTFGGHKTPKIFILQALGYQFFKSLGPLGLLPWGIERVSLWRSNHFIATSPSLAQQLRQRVGPEANIRIIPYGVDEELFKISVSENRYILFLGRLDIYQKGLDILLKAFQQVSRRFPNHKLIIAGAGRQEKHFRSMVAKSPAKDKVELVGRVIGERKRDLLGNSLLVCMPSRFESWGIVAIEAGAANKPVIGTKIRGLIDSIKDGETGILVPPERPDLLAEKMIFLIENEGERKRLGCNGRLWAKNFNWDDLAKEQERFYFEVIKTTKF